MPGRVDYRGKRTADLVMASLAAIVLAPVIAVIAVIVKLTSPGPVLHQARRVGRDGHLFTLYKFRSMRPRAASEGPGITAAGDVRITKVGGVLRATKLDELPQLWNVLRGDMSLVGPRPEDPRYVEWYTPPQRRVLAWRPGITSPASVTYRDEESLLRGAPDVEVAYRDVMASKIEIDLAYFESGSFSGDVRWLARTARAILQRSDGADNG